MSKTGYASLETEAVDGVEGEPVTKEDDLEAGEEADAALEPQKPLCTPTRICAGVVVLVALSALGVIALLFHHRSMNIEDPVPDKRGAGLFLVSGTEVLLLRRNSKHNDNTWGLPGGNAEGGDADLLATAMREAGEEMRGVPSLNVTGQVLTKRGKKGQKQYTVFVCTVDAAAKATFQPVLNAEHREAKWWPLDALPPISKLHPVVATLVEDPGAHKQVDAALPAGVSLGGGALHGAGLGSALAVYAGGNNTASERVEKSGAGLLLADGGKVLLLRKTGGKHGPGKWQMPGGSADSKDADALATAEREALDEVGGVPSHEVIGQVVLRKQGKKGVKQFTVVLANVDQAGASETFEPKAEDDHHEVQWVDLRELSGLPVDKLQPHLAEVLSEEHKAELQAAFGNPL